MGMEHDSNPLRHVELVAVGQGAVEVSASLPVGKGGFERLMPGVSPLFPMRAK